MPTSNNDRELGEMSSRIETLEREVHEIKVMVREVRDDMLRAKGGWKALAMVGGLSATAGGIVVKVLSAIGFPPVAPHP